LQTIAGTETFEVQLVDEKTEQPVDGIGFYRVVPRPFWLSRFIAIAGTLADYPPEPKYLIATTNEEGIANIPLKYRSQTLLLEVDITEIILNCEKQSGSYTEFFVNKTIELTVTVDAATNRYIVKVPKTENPSPL